MVRHRITRRLSNMSPEQKQLLLFLLTEKIAIMPIHGELYGYRRVRAGWIIRSLHEGEPEHTVFPDFSACSCQDCRFRGKICKHMTALKGVLDVTS